MAALTPSAFFARLLLSRVGATLAPFAVMTCALAYGGPQRSAEFDWAAGALSVAAGVAFLLPFPSRLWLRLLLAAFYIPACSLLLFAYSYAYALNVYHAQPF